MMRFIFWLFLQATRLLARPARGKSPNGAGAEELLTEVSIHWLTTGTLVHLFPESQNHWQRYLWE